MTVPAPAVQIPGSGHEPAVSVIIATYNRSQPLAHAMRSVLAQTFTDWELIVVGDACTDDTETCVQSFRDPRIRFVNLPQRQGYQSGPHNHGLTLARGRLIAFLNHDDLFFPDHLDTAVAGLEQTGADLVWVPVAMALPREAAPHPALPCAFELTGVPPSSDYWPGAFYFASSWLFRRKLAERVGPWCRPEDTYQLPSQEWLFRAWRRGAQLRFLPRLTVLAISPGHASTGYRQRESPDHDRLVRWLREDPRARERILEQTGLAAAMQRLEERFHPGWQALRRWFLRPVYHFLPAWGIHPQTFYGWIRRWTRGSRRGDSVRLHRQHHGADEPAGSGQAGS